MIGLYIKLGLAAAVIAFVGWKHIQYLDAKKTLAETKGKLEHAELQVKAHEEVANAISAKQAKADAAAARVEALLAEARRESAVVRANDERLRQLTAAIANRAAGDDEGACERNRRDVVALASVVERSSRALERGADLAREAAARLEGCQSLVSSPSQVSSK